MCIDTLTNSAPKITAIIGADSFAVEQPPTMLLINFDFEFYIFLLYMVIQFILEIFPQPLRFIVTFSDFHNKVMFISSQSIPHTIRTHPF
jgi:hypothetical protein